MKRVRAFSSCLVVIGLAHHIGMPSVASAQESLDEAISSQLDSKTPAKSAKGKKKKATIEERWEQALTQNAKDTYVVQPGDTLPQISQTLFGDSAFWSKMWAQNRWIENPYNLKPGKVIWVTAGTVADAPSFSVSDAPLIRMNSLNEPWSPAPTYKEEAAKQISRKDYEEGLVEESELIPRPVLPPGGARAPILKSLPPSFVSYRSKFSTEFDSTDLLVGQRKARTVPASFIPSSYLAEDRPLGMGTVEEIEKTDQVAGSGQAVFLRLNRAVEPGTRLSVIFPHSHIRDSERSADFPIVEIGGVVEVQKAVEKNYYRAIVTYAVNPIRKGSVVSDEALPRVTASADGAQRSEARVRVLGGDNDENRRMFGRGSVIYLDGGSGAGLHAGDLVAIQSRRGERRELTAIPNATQPIAVVKVIKVQPSVATALVLQSEDEIMPGDRSSSEFPHPVGSLRIDSTQDISKNLVDTEAASPETPTAKEAPAPSLDEDPALKDDGADKDKDNIDLDLDTEITE